jgi:hypothetical protein
VGVARSKVRASTPWKSSQEMKLPPKHLRYPDMKVPKSKTPQPVYRMRSPFGYETDVVEHGVDPLLRLGWEVMDADESVPSIEN